MTLPHLTWLCPTWNRPAHLANLVRQFLAQDYPADRRELLILCDSGQFDNQRGDGWELIAIPRRFHSLPEKYNALLGLVSKDSDAVVVAEDDDLYSPGHSSASAAALSAAEFSKPSQVLMTHRGATRLKDARGRFHASLAMNAEWLRRLGGWPNVRELNFDKRLMGDMTQHGRLGDPIKLGFPPTYTYVWDGVRGHGSAFRKFGLDWYDKAAEASGPVPYIGKLVI